MCEIQTLRLLYSIQSVRYFRDFQIHTSNR